MTAEAIEVEGWYVSRDGEMDGPLSDAEMRAEIGNGVVKPEHLVWREGMALWVEAREIPNYNDLRQAHLDEALADGREKSRDRVRAQKPWGGDARTVKPANRAEARAEAAARSASSAPVRPAPAAKPQPAPWEPVKSDETLVEAEKIAKKALGKLSGIPTGTIAFFVLGLIFTPMLPIFWLIAWWIYSGSKR